VNETPRTIRDLRDILARAGQPIPPELNNAIGSGSGGGRGRGRGRGGGRGGYGGGYGGAPPQGGYGGGYGDYKREREDYRPEDRYDGPDRRGPRPEGRY